MSAIIAFVIVLTLSLLVTRLATAALMLTGVSHQLARLQSLSALTGVGFTTSESESIVNHAVRRRILILIMLIGNAGVVTEGSTLVLSFVGVTTRAEGLIRAAWLVGGLLALWMVARSKWIERHMLQVMGWACAGGPNWRPTTSSSCWSWPAATASGGSGSIQATGWKASGSTI